MLREWEAVIPSCNQSRGISSLKSRKEQILTTVLPGSITSLVISRDSDNHQASKKLTRAEGVFMEQLLSWADDLGSAVVFITGGNSVRDWLQDFGLAPTRSS